MLSNQIFSLFSDFEIFILRLIIGIITTILIFVFAILVMFSVFSFYFPFLVFNKNFEQKTKMRKIQRIESDNYQNWRCLVLILCEILYQILLFIYGFSQNFVLLGCENTETFRHK